jgi:hypothetical protein
MHIGYCWESQKKRDHWGDQDVGGGGGNIKMDLKRDRMGWCALDRYGSGQGPVEGSCEHGIELLVSIKCWEVLDGLHNWRLLKKGSAP